LKFKKIEKKWMFLELKNSENFLNNEKKSGKTKNIMVKK